ncbi:hypothetical protein [Oryzobacter terrae]|uniref:hypothetical protein n=1 Tax=Oryzobacter terrae TaxID=1620385 RepID=UPI00367265AD
MNPEVAVERVAVSSLVPGQTIELTGSQKLWDVTKTPWRELVPPARLRVLEVVRMASGSTEGRQPYEVTLLADDGARVDLEVADGEELVAVVPHDDAWPAAGH